MENNKFLIPANAKQSTLMFGLFNKIDLIVLVVGAVITLIMFYVVDISGIFNAVLVLIPGLVAVMLIVPLPNYHNALTIAINAYMFFTKRQKFVWKGWCFYDIKDDETEIDKSKQR